jgi:anti-sigma B factor antagonist
MALTEEREIRQGMLAVRTARHDGARVVSLEGELDLANAEVAETALREAIEDESTRLVVDMHELTFIDSTGIALLVSLMRSERCRGRLSFVPSSSPEVVRVLQITGIEGRFPREKSGLAHE